MILTREQVRSIDRRAIEEYGMSGLVLMENAGRGVAEIVRDHYRSGSVVICCGGGNNAGDGLVIARHLDNWRIPVSVLQFADPAKYPADTMSNFVIARRAGIAISAYYGGSYSSRWTDSLAGATVVVDGLLGTGAQGPPRPPYDEVIRQINAHPALTIAVDLPSGLDCDTGQPAEPTVRAAHTCTFVAKKPGLAVPAALPFCGTIHVIDIGVPRQLIGP